MANVTGVRRSQSTERASDVTWITGDLAVLPDQIRGGAGFEACVHAAAVVHRPSAPVEETYRVNVEQTLALARALARQPDFRRFVFASTVAVNEYLDGGAATPYARSKLEAEQRLAALAEGLGLEELVVVRIATVYGNRDRGNIGKLYDAIRHKRYVRVVPGHTKKSLISSGSVGAALAAAAIYTDGPLPRLTLLADSEPYTLEEIERSLAAAAGVRTPPALPSALARWTGNVARKLDGAVPPVLQHVVGPIATLSRSAMHYPEPASPILEAAVRAKPDSLEDGFRQAYSSDRGAV